MVRLVTAMAERAHEKPKLCDARLVATVSEPMIAEAIANGDLRQAIALCSRAYGASLGRLCFAFAGSKAEAEELTQETFVAAYGSLAQYRGEGTIKAFLFGIARRICARFVETRARQSARLRLVHNADAQESDASVSLATARRANRARVALEQLRPTEREALLLRYQADLSFQEVAAACGCDEAAARKRVSRGLLRLRELLKDDLEEVL